MGRRDMIKKNRSDKTNRMTKKRYEASEYNRKNHTHFKTLNANHPSGFKSHHPMTVGVPLKTAIEHRRYQLDLLYAQFNVRSKVSRELLKELEDKGLATSIFTGAKGIQSTNRQAFLHNLLATLVKEHKIVYVYEVVATPTNTITNRCGRYRYLKNTQCARSIEELRKVKVASTAKIRYCIKCIQALLH